MKPSGIFVGCWGREPLGEAKARAGDYAASATRATNHFGKKNQGQSFVKLHIFVISLPGELARRESVTRQLDSMNLPWSFFDAISYRDTDVRALWGEAQLAAGEARYGRVFTLGEIACAQSHFELYRQLANSEFDVGLILEDDFLAEPNFPEFVTALQCGEADWFDLLFLGYSKLTPAAQATIYRFMPILSERSLASVRVGKAWREWTYGNVAYAVTRKAAAKIVSEPRLYTLADDWAALKVHYQLQVRHARPLLVRENFEVFPSALENDRAHLLKPYYQWLDFARYLRGYMGLWIMKLRAWRE